MHKRITINSNSNNLLYISTTKIEDGFTTVLHSHPNLECLLITEGNGYIVTTNRKIEIKAHDIVIINPNSMHCEINEGLRFYAIGIRDVEIFLKETFTKKIIARPLSYDDYKKIFFMYDLMYDEARHNDRVSESIINACYDITFNILDRRYSIAKNDSSVQEETDLVSNIKSILDNYYSKDIKLDEIAHRLSQSKSNICHAFKKETGVSIIEYKITKQLEEACNLLIISDMNISDICFQVGFNDTAYFTKTFKKYYNMTPKEYRIKRKTKE